MFFSNRSARQRRLLPRVSQLALGELPHQCLIDRLAADGVIDPVLITVGAVEAAALRRTFPSVRTHLNLPFDLGRARELVAELKLDILVYADIGMNPLSYFLPFSRLALVQCAMWGHPVTSGIPSIDYFVLCSSRRRKSAALEDQVRRGRRILEGGVVLGD